ncbi:hypothetical protein LTR37_005421 [Vermiconidia calcicola]|uniref:Uncharacterized protein n=1 Tax=Vermiconidia calcicola TaxID=1690605 RepID=A0ACC3NJK1_9PEZI|nr:hypothetical protein LTR37_005421 [Vermiconidia calcicola]
MANKKTNRVVIGDVNGRLSEVFNKLSTLQPKQNFTFAIISGNLFADPWSATQTQNDEVSKLLSGEIEVPLTTYFALGTRKLPQSVFERLESSDGELCPNLFLLGRKVSIKTSDGFRIAAIGGSYVPGTDEPMSPYGATYTDTDAQALAKAANDVDLLITSDWPAAVQDGSQVACPGQSPQGVQSIADLCTALKPRYHFSTSEAFYEREPFFHPGPSPRSITRFLSLAPFGNPDKQKAMYAFTIEPSAPPPTKVPDGTTASPFFNTKKRKLDSQQDSYNNFRYANGNSNDSNYRGRGGRHNNKRHQRNQTPPTPQQCFFCLSNEACETHMIGSIGTDCYVAVAKGPLTTREMYPDLGFSGHMLIIPLQHSPTISHIPDKEAQKSTVAEVQRYRSAMHDMLASKSQDASGRSKLGAVTWEISRAGGVHLHWQFLPIPVDKIQRGLVEVAFDVEAENLEYPPFVKSSSQIAEAEDAGEDYLKVMIWSESLRKEMLLLIDRSFRFDLQFPRRVLAKLLELDNRMDWKACAQAQEEEAADADAFKEAFKAFDFSLEEE